MWRLLSAWAPAKPPFLQPTINGLGSPLDNADATLSRSTFSQFQTNCEGALFGFSLVV
jgi:hypothetical protein